MPRPKNPTPKYCNHKASGRGYVTLGGERIYLGRYGTPESRDRYSLEIAEWIQRGRRPVTPANPTNPDAGPTISQVIAQFWKHAVSYYIGADGKPTGEAAAFKVVLGVLKRLYGPSPAGEFGPLKLKALREHLLHPTEEIDKSTGKVVTRNAWSRQHINKNIGRIKAVFKWATGEELVPSGIYHALQSVSALKRGRTDAKENKPVRPVPDSILQDTLPHLSQTLQDMVNLQLVTGMRPGELCAMRGQDIDMSGKLWLYVPSKHKTEHHGHKRTIFLGKKAQEIVKQYLKTDVSAFLFSPEESEAKRLAKLQEDRTTPTKWGNRPGSNRKSRPARKAGNRYSRDSYRRAIIRGCERAFMLPENLVEPRTPKQIKAAKESGRMTPEAILSRRSARTKWRDEHSWHPHQLRHNAATFLRKQFGVEAAQVILGHATLTVTQLYAEKNIQQAMRIVSEVG